MSSDRATVSIVKGALFESPFEYSEKDLRTVREMIERSLDLIGGLRQAIGSAGTVVVKPNLVEVPFEGTAGSVVTDARVLEALVGILKDYGVKRVLVAEGKSVNLKHVESGPRQAFEALGLGDVIRRAGGEILGWDEGEFVAVDVPGGELYRTINVPRSILDADAFISVPKLKTHCQTEVTVGMKSMQGVFSVDDKVNFHNEAFPWKMVDMLRVAKPHVTIVDGLICGEGYGPIYTEPVEMNLIVSSTDVVAIDAVCSAIMGIDPFDVPITRLGHTEGIGIGDLARIDVCGESIDSVMKHFKRAGEWNPIGSSDRIRVFAGGACRFCLAQIGAAVTRLRYEGKLDGLDDICVIIGHNAPSPVRDYKNVFIIGDCARDTDIEGTFIGGCPPLPSVQIVRAFEKHLKED
ncbi:MAG: DUF362 domain-containing protein [Lentisphaerae bacterium]|jgi:uncharacterized protein (DUF362 family)|nr:DUF362 domain-containing protein [Lentisphaerota bacterium]MBT4821684.1 DUF362 domain-containing protein [Lentisphaerota bacterium]MBT5609375.1 DUF362 domain-containing protein [Lentisphaerota bacterium]MBT7060787.1 DUF362 domain-containing protein [Lentisphaerota bacterium]MBT7843498.1 DUF362 domain-containing protein [Lentisphaerota bacterium]